MPAVGTDRIVITRGEGCYVWDTGGRKLFDTTAALWYANVGHGRAEIADAVADQMRRLETFHSFGRYTNDVALDLAERVAAMAPLPDGRVFFTSGGSDAVDTAGKLARRHWDLQGRSGKRTVISRELAYHGLHAFGTSIAGLEANRVGYGELIRETLRVPPNDADALEATIARHGADTIAAFIAEPVIGTGGVVPPAPGYLNRVAEICRDNDILFIADEVITGFGRTGQLFGCRRYGVEPDIVLMAKGITSGYLPLGAVVAAPPIWEPYWTGDADFKHGLTYSGHAAACAAAMANLDIIEREGLVGHVAAMEPVLADALAPVAAHPLVREVRGPVGLLAGVALNDPDTATAVAEAAVDAGYVTRVIVGDTLQISPPFVVTAEELRRLAADLLRLLDAAG
ncbi:aspartate aminotransferase family protein [Pseudonocardia sp. K10HN5]|uniref:Aspartate aminotransferase family protein n=2 Tax=Pseudonocardia acidicola TaxID=2724939 RepID=A0ABX1S2M7_9PSEU|nr:aspartate aminotransferase family protein [Pseudonocardia acidicola]